MKKRFIVAGIILLMILFSACSGGGKNCYEPLEMIIAGQGRALEAHEALSNAFGFYSIMATPYPKDFAGAWIERGRLYVAITSGDVGRGAYRQVLAGFEDVVIFVDKTHGLNYLLELQQAAFALFWSMDKSITSGHVETQTGRVHIGFEAEYYEGLYNLLSDNLSLDLVEEIFVFVWNQPRIVLE